MNSSNLIKKGFSLIEALIVIGIISILLAVAIPVYQTYLAETKAGLIKTNLHRVKQSYAACLSQYDYADCNTANKLELSIDKAKILPTHVASYFFDNSDFTAVKQCFKVEIQDVTGCVSFVNGEVTSISKTKQEIVDKSSICTKAACTNL